jgi:hypothetical protein
MRGPMYFIGAYALVAAATIFVWSHFVPDRSLSVAEAATASSGSSTEMTVNHQSPLPVEQWDAF